MTFGDNLINLRKQNKMTQEEVSEKLGITRQTVSNWELNQTKPDLDQLIGLSKLYNISLDILANNNVKDIKSNEIRNHKKFNTLFSKFKDIFSKNKRVCIMIFTLICIIAIGTCLIVDYSINNMITWGYIPLLSIVFAYLSIIPLFAKKHKILLSFCAITITILPFLYLLEKAISIKGWFNLIALPITSISIIGLWISYLFCYFLKINIWYKTAIIIFMWNGIISPIINHIVDGLPYVSFQNFRNLFSSLVFSLICIICSYIKVSKKK